jgi:hypothetical protein
MVGWLKGEGVGPPVRRRFGELKVEELGVLLRMEVVGSFKVQPSTDPTFFKHVRRV